MSALAAQVRGLVAGFAAAVLCALAACERPASPPTAQPGNNSYTVRARVVALPDPSRKGSPELIARHERIPDFKDRDGTIAVDPSTGEAVGMPVMVMPFPLSPGLRLEGIAVGDAVEIDFTVDWGRFPAHFATAIRRLPPGTRMAFETD